MLMKYTVTGLFITLLLLSACSQGGMKEEAAAADSISSGSEKPDHGTKNNLPENLTWKRASKTANLTKLFIGDTEELKLQGCQVAVKVDGFRARVLIDYYYHNDRPQQLEGNFKLQLPAEASPYYFAFGQSVLLNESTNDLPFIRYKESLETEKEDIAQVRAETWENVKEAVIAPREKAAFAYTQTVKRKVDPALMEWAGPDIFNCRVFPLMPGQTHRITIGYDVNLAEISDVRSLDLPIPQECQATMLDVDIARNKNLIYRFSPEVKLETSDERIRFHSDDFNEESITISCSTDKPVVIYGDHKNETYFAASLSLNLPDKIHSISSDKAILAIDYSLSSNPDKFNIWLKLAESILSENKNSIKKFNVLFFSVGSSWWKEDYIENTPENIEELLAYAHQIALEGATDISGALKNIYTKADKQTDVFFLSDGAATWGEDGASVISGQIVPGIEIYAYKTGIEGSNNRLLEKITGMSGGSFFTVSSEQEVSKASTAHLRKPWKLEAISAEGCSDLLIAGNPSYIYPSQQLVLTGRGKPSGEIRIKVSQGAFSPEYVIDTDIIIESELASRLYGQIATGLLEEVGTRAEQYSLAYATEFSIPGQTCSLVMLESDFDYDRHGIKAENHGMIVLSSEVNKIIRLNKSQLSFNQPKEELISQLEKLSETDGNGIRIPSCINALIDDLPDNAFQIKEQKHNIIPFNRNKLSKDLLYCYQQENLDYEKITAEAETRKNEAGKESALLVLSSLAEKNPGNTVILYDIAYTALEMDLPSDAYFLLKKINRIRPYEPNTYLGIAQVLSAMNNDRLAMIYYEIAVNTEWPATFTDFRAISQRDYLHFLRIQKRNKQSEIPLRVLEARSKELENEIAEKQASVVSCIMWNTDNTDIDLHVTEPDGETCNYSNRETRQGGRLSQDVRTGYGPEMYTCEKADPGTYNVKVNYYSGDQNRTSSRTRVYATIYLNWGKPDEKVIRKAITLKETRDTQDVMDFYVKN
jgi:hypothetical protein